MKMLNTFLVVLVTLISVNLSAQKSPDFSLEAYKLFLQQNAGLEVSELKSMHPSDVFAPNAPRTYTTALYSDSVFKYYQFNENEINLLEENGFMVSDRVRYESFGEAFLTVYKRDLPVYISSDAILHALHMSYSEILRSLERSFLYDRLDTLLTSLHAEIPVLESTYETSELVQTSLRDLDIYLTIPKILLGNEASPYFPENGQKINELLDLIEGEQPSAFPLFSDIPRNIDFSQFTPRGHYAQSEKLTRYFKAMMWIGRTELYLVPPKAIPYISLSEEKKDSIGQRQTITSYLINEGLKKEEATLALNDIDELIGFLVGESDNVLNSHLEYLKEKTGFGNVSDLQDLDTYKAFKENLEEEPFAGQKILSQILVKDPFSPDQIEPSSTYLLLGQRFIIDSYILGSVVFDKISKKRMLPKSADVLFALGNNDALAILESDLEEFEYSSNLAALRFLIDSYESEYWETSFFNLWLNSIRKLNPPEDRTVQPDFMQTKAWSDKTMNTQLAAWAQIRHDNLLYAKQSYSGGVTCEFPATYVEPNPEFFNSVGKLATITQASISELQGLPSHWKNAINTYFGNMRTVVEKLELIALNQLEGVNNTEEQTTFLKDMIYEGGGCGIILSGWYANLYYTGDTGAMKKDFIVADVHTAPTDEQGNMVGWVMHAGTGPLNIASIIAELPDGNEYAFVGPVMSYYEHVSTNFDRLTDEEWVETFEDNPAMRPEFTESYLSVSGSHYYDSRFYVPVASSNEGEQFDDVPNSIELAQNYPNPFNAGTVIGFRIPASLSNKPAVLQIFNVQGQLIETLINQPLSSGNYSVRWNANVSSGTYFYRLKVGDEEVTQKMLFLK